MPLPNDHRFDTWLCPWDFSLVVNYNICIGPQNYFEEARLKIQLGKMEVDKSSINYYIKKKTAWFGNAQRMNAKYIYILKWNPEENSGLLAQGKLWIIVTLKKKTCYLGFGTNFGHILKIKTSAGTNVFASLIDSSIVIYSYYSAKWMWTKYQSHQSLCSIIGR